VQVVAHFGASWCVTSLSMNYKFEELAQTHPEVLFLYVDVDDVQVNKQLFDPVYVYAGLMSWFSLGPLSDS
jgi:thiol-disulfide isomerase/thioredoxin